MCTVPFAPMMSPPSWAAWIEIDCDIYTRMGKIRRRLHGRRGLKYLRITYWQALIMSPPSRAAWIEISSCSGAYSDRFVAAFTGGVD